MASALTVDAVNGAAEAAVTFAEAVVSFAEYVDRRRDRSGEAKSRAAHPAGKARRC